MLYSNPFGTNYPFINPPFNNPELYTTQYVQDFYITYYRPSLDYKLPLKLQSISINNIHVTDQNNNTIYNGPVSKRVWNNKSYILQHTSNDLCIYAIVDMSLTGTFVPVNSDLCLRSTFIQPKHITSFIVSNNTLKNDIVLAEGSNIAYTVGYEEEDSIRPLSLITIDAEPGNGTGQVPSDCYSEKNIIHTINGITSDSTGNLSISGDGCIEISIVGTDTALAIRDECEACCKCKDFTKAANILDNNINEYYTIGARAEAVRDCVLDIKDLLTCGTTVLMHTDEFCPVRAYLDTTWPRKPIISAEFRNVLPAVISGLKIKVTAECSPLVKFKALRTMYMEDVTCTDVYKDTQESDNYNRIYPALADNLEEHNTWTIDWSDTDIAPGGTIWCTVAARNCGINRDKTGQFIGYNLPEDSWKYVPDEYIKVTVEAEYTMKPNECMVVANNRIEDCFDGFTIHKDNTIDGWIKGGYSYDDSTSLDSNVIHRVEDLCRQHGGECNNCGDYYKE